MKSLVCSITLLALAGPASAQVVQKKTLTLEGARRVINAAVAAARDVHAPGGSIAVVDDGGHLIALERLDNTFAASADISIGKARTAAIFKKPTGTFEDIINHGRTSMVALADFTPLIGGVPIVVDGETVGAVGVSGAASAQQDAELATAGAAALNGATVHATNGWTSAAGTAPQVTYFARPIVAAAFAEGKPLLETTGYKVHASRRVEPGMAEIHARDTDVIYVLQGSAVVITGGEAVDLKTIGPGEQRGSRIKGGQSRRLEPGDVMVIPNGVPHWFREVNGPFLYFVVKPEAPAGNGR